MEERKVRRWRFKGGILEMDGDDPLFKPPTADEAEELTVQGPRTVEEQLANARKYRARLSEKSYGNDVLLLRHELCHEELDRDRCPQCGVDFWGAAAEYVMYPHEYAVHLPDFPRSKALCSHCAEAIDPKVKLLCDIGNIMEDAALCRSWGGTPEEREKDVAINRQQLDEVIEKYIQKVISRLKELDNRGKP